MLTLNAPFNSATLHERKLYLYISHASLQHPLECELAIARKRLSPSASATLPTSSSTAPRYACVPKFVGIRELEGALDLIKLHSGHVERIVLLTSSDPREPCLSLTAGWGSHLPMKLSLGPMKLFDPYNILQYDQIRVTAGSHRTIAASQPLRRILSLGSAGRFELIDGEYRRHRMEVQLSPANAFVADLFRVLSTVLPNYAGDFLLEIWWNIRKTLSVDGVEMISTDWIAFVATLFSLAIPFIDGKAQKVNSRPRSRQRRSLGRPSSQAKPDEIIDGDDTAWHLMCSRQISNDYVKSWESTSWAWALASTPSSSAMSPPSKRSMKQEHSPKIMQQIHAKENLLSMCIDIARQFVQSPIGKATNDHWRRSSPSEKQDLRISSLSEIVVTLHLFREELKLNTLCQTNTASSAGDLAPVLAQLSHWLRWDAWDWRQGGYYDLDGGSSDKWTLR